MLEVVITVGLEKNSNGKRSVNVHFSEEVSGEDVVKHLATAAYSTVRAATQFAKQTQLSAQRAQEILREAMQPEKQE